MTCKAEYLDATDAHHGHVTCRLCGAMWDRFSKPSASACLDAKAKWHRERARGDDASAIWSPGASTDASAIWHPGAPTAAAPGPAPNMWVGNLRPAETELRVSDTGGVKASIGKRPLHLLPRDAIEAVADVMALGAAKYGDRNWERGLSVSDLVRAADGHLWDWFLRRNDGRDPQFGTSHLAHAACCVLFLLAHELRGMPDDRPPAVPEVSRPTKEG